MDILDNKNGKFTKDVYIGIQLKIKKEASQKFSELMRSLS